uniref:Uncharacterized protein n=1 Tax=Anguilla anguilla TaxID=7936 RepID=A0A0E9SB63_ANGAN
MMHHMMNRDTSQQVILVQVNPGETFTIRAEDGPLQCIQGTSAEVDPVLTVAPVWFSTVFNGDITVYFSWMR